MHIADHRWDHGKFDQSEVNNAQTVTAVFFTYVSNQNSVINWVVDDVSLYKQCKSI